MEATTYVVSNELAKISSLLPSNKKRSLIVHSLINALGLLSHNQDQEMLPIRVVKPVPAQYDDLAAYHTRDYLEFILDPKNSSGAVVEQDDVLEYGMEDDCPPFPGLPHYVRYVAGATLTAVRDLREGRCKTAICWDGGRHHAQKSRASGFCYVADCVLAILALRRLLPDPHNPAVLRKPKVMYLDLDLHFSDGVYEAFHTSSSSQASSHFLHLSIHHAAPGFFPASPLAVLPDPSAEGFNPYTLSLPLQRGASDATFARIWKLVENVKDAFRPDFVVLQCGVDGLAGDPYAVWNWGLSGAEGSFAWCVGRVLAWGCRTLLLGGGGYSSPNAARAWAYITALARKEPLPVDTPIPDHSGFPLYAPSFTLDVPAGHMQDQNTDAYLTEVERIYGRAVSALRERDIEAHDDEWATRYIPMFLDVYEDVGYWDYCTG
ncbi:histone deacetylase complex protein [Gloeophyllum trabeum ATCC 11539]|uniref:histone deacetylase n=1 Tax=Gloeophyllum trabeum (strain ATCC 11539 / FP-39264 / Madison 617) TaxID=670483 RepID=S7RLG2_GLOTA|nr:histone deacetylase complex protein [Gloeophyllum trabeum ATCC 11539]EPQ53489.1 histone deacetylase complex protein [Gloeophyllum trabeum ATCC 11539]